MSNRRRSVLLGCLMSLLVTAPITGAPRATEQASLRVVRPAQGALVQGDTVAVEIEVEGVVLGGRSRNGAYALLTLDEMPPVKSLAPLFRFRGVAAGEHGLTVELRRPDGSPFEPVLRVRVEFRTRPERTGRS